MKGKTLIVMSDSHGDRSIVEEVKQYYLGKVDAIFHNGDSELRAEDEIWHDIYVVAGNLDFSGGYADRLINDLDDGIRVVQTHGHLFEVNDHLEKLGVWAQEEEATICLYGHLHTPNTSMRGGILFVNPGSISQPRGCIAEPLYARIDVTDDSFVVTYLARNHQVYSSLTQQFSRLYP